MPNVKLSAFEMSAVSLGVSLQDDFLNLYRDALAKMDSPPTERRKPTFGIGKTIGGTIGMQRTVVHFSKPPQPYPLSLCCSLPGGFIGNTERKY